MLKYLIALANELDKYGELEAADIVDSLIQSTDLISVKDLPPLKDEHVRLIHFTIPENLSGIKQNGLNYGWDATTTVRPYSNAQDAALATNTTDRRYKGGVAVIFDMPFAEWRKHTRVQTATGNIGPEYIIGSVPEGMA